MASEVQSGDERSDAGAIRMSVLNAVIEMTAYRSTYPASSPDEARRVLSQGFAASTGHAYSEAAVVLASLPSFRLPPDGDRAGALRVLLRELTVARPPSWARMIPKGRRHLAAYLSPNARQCLEAAGLYETLPSAAVLEWWDGLASHFRSMSDEDRTRTGREGERLTLRYETSRLAAAGRPDLTPKWVSLDDNSLGYDVLSYELTEGGESTPLHIECKASSVSSKEFFLTRNEWRVAESMNDRYSLHFWDLRGQRLKAFTVADLRAHIPMDQGRGEWQNVRIDARRGPAAKGFPESESEAIH